MEKKEITDSVKNLSEKRVIKVKQIPEYPLCKSFEEGKKLLIDTAKIVDLTIKEFKWLPEYDKVVNWMMKPNRKGLQLMGDPGRLKTVIATLVFPVLYHHIYGFTVRPVEVSDIENEEVLKRFEQSPIIIIDDVGTELPINDYGIKREPIKNLIDFCEKKSKLLIITSNLKSELITLRYDLRVTDRLDLLCEAVWFGGESLR